MDLDLIFSLVALVVVVGMIAFAIKATKGDCDD
jgi:hypothetical protein